MISDAKKIVVRVPKKELDDLLMGHAQSDARTNGLSGYEVDASSINGDGYSGFEVTLYLKPKKVRK